jgi:predicted esterase YcpF (UPF0227 family)
MNILYVHGFGSKYDPHGDKAVALHELGTVYGINLDYSQGSQTVLEQASQAVRDLDIDLVVGTSMGGWCAAQVGHRLGLPFVSVNPCTHPSTMLSKYLGTHTDHYGREFTLTESTLVSYPDMPLSGYGLILLDMGDEVIDSTGTLDYLAGSFRVVSYPGGDHRFQHMPASIDTIEQFYNLAAASHGVDG